MSNPFSAAFELWQSARQRRAVRIALLAIYYALIVTGLIAMYGRGDFSTPPFVYQGF